MINSSDSSLFGYKTLALCFALSAPGFYSHSEPEFGRPRLIEPTPIISEVPNIPGSSNYVAYLAQSPTNSLSFDFYDLWLLNTKNSKKIKAAEKIFMPRGSRPLYMHFSKEKKADYVFITFSQVTTNPITKIESAITAHIPQPIKDLDSLKSRLD